MNISTFQIHDLITNTLLIMKITNIKPDYSNYTNPIIKYELEIPVTDLSRMTGNHSFFSDQAIAFLSQFKAAVDEYSTTEDLELAKCLDRNTGLHYFAKKYFKVQNPTTGIASLDMHDYVIRYFNTCLSETRIDATFDRQMGGSTLTACYQLWKAMFTPDQHIGIASGNMSNDASLDLIRRAYDNLPNRFKDCSSLDVNSKNHLHFSNGSSIRLIAIDSPVIRGLRVELLCISQFKQAAIIHSTATLEFLASMRPWISQVLLLSDKYWSDAALPDEAVNFKSQMHKYIAVSSEHPSRDTAWKVATIKQLGIDNFIKEYTL